MPDFLDYLVTRADITDGATTPNAAKLREAIDARVGLGGGGGGLSDIVDATTTVAGKVRRSTAAEVDAGDDVNAYVSPARAFALVSAKVAALKTDLLGGATSGWDTLQELKALIDALTTIVSQKLAKASNLSDLPDPAAARTNLGAAATTTAQALVRWTGSSWPARPTGAAFGVVFLSTNDPLATPPPATGLLVGDVWRKHPDAA